MATAHKIRHVLDLLKHRVIKDEDVDCRALLSADYRHIARSTDTYGRRLELLVFITTSLIQIIDPRRSLTETMNISRLTYLALSFIPFTFVSGLFSMNDDIASGGKLFGLYFAVSNPLCILVFPIVHPPTSTPSTLAARIWRPKAMQEFIV